MRIKWIMTHRGLAQNVTYIHCPMSIIGVNEKTESCVSPQLPAYPL